MNAENFRYVVEFEKTVDKRFDLDYKERVFFTNRSSAVSWIKELQRFDKNSTFKKFNIRELKNV